MKNSILFYSLPCFIFFSAIFWMKTSVDFWGWSLIEAFTLLLFLRLLFKKNGFILPSLRLFVPLLLLTLYCSCSILWSSNIHATLTALYKIFFVLFLLILFSNEPQNWQNAIQTSVLATSAGAALFTLFSSKWRLSFPNLSGGFLALGGILSAGLFLTSHGIHRLKALFCSILIACSLILTLSLGPLLSWAGGVALQFWIHASKKSRLLGLLFLLFFSLAFTDFISMKVQGTTATWVGKPLQNIWKRKISDPFAGERIQIWKDSIHYFFHHPWIGTGLGTFRDVYPEFKTISGFRNAPYAHNEALNFVCELGLTGVFFLTWTIWTFLISVRKNKGEEEKRDWKLWPAVTFAALFHSLIDFNLHYPPILILFLFSISIFIPTRSVPAIASPLSRLAVSLLLTLLGTLFLLPGIADLLFKKHYKDSNLRQRGALMALRFDPLNALYHFESGRMRNVLIAIDLEPRNVWFRREAAQFFIREWKKSKNESALKSAREQYDEILNVAPSVFQFRKEAENLPALKNF